MINFEPLDIAACYGTDWTSNAIRFGTASLFAPPRLRVGPSHVAVLCRHEGRMVWVESTTLCRHPCVIRGERFNGCQAHDPSNRIADYVNAGGRVDLYRLAPIESLSADESDLLTSILIRHFVRGQVQYDMGGALISGTRLFKATRLLPDADLNKLFCSELIAAVCMRLNRMNRRNPTRYNPACLLRELVRTGTHRYVETFDRERVSCAN